MNLLGYNHHKEEVDVYSTQVTSCARNFVDYADNKKIFLKSK